MPHPRLSPERIREIPVLELDDDEFLNSQKGGLSSIKLGDDFLRLAPDGSYSLKSSGKSWKLWQSQHPWVPIENTKHRDYFARGVHSNPISRQFLESLDSEVGRVFIQDLKVRGGMEHTQRLVTAYDAPTLTTFSLAYWAALIPHDQERMAFIRKALPVSLDGNAATQFWGFAPFIFEKLRTPTLGQPSMTPKEAINFILDWSNARKPYGTEDDAEYPGVSSYFLLERGFFLANTATHPSHALARKVGTHIADHLRPLLASNP